MKMHFRPYRVWHDVLEQKTVCGCDAMANLSVIFIEQVDCKRCIKSSAGENARKRMSSRRERFRVLLSGPMMSHRNFKGFQDAFIFMTSPFRGCFKAEICAITEPL